MDIISALTFTVVFLFSSGSVPLSQPAPIGTAFILQQPIPHKTNQFIPLIVTAKHVLNNRKKIFIRFNSLDPSGPVLVELDLLKAKSENDYWEHPDIGVDIALIRTPHFLTTTYEAIPIDFIATKRTFADEEIKPTDRILFPGLLRNFFGKHINYPVVKDGSIALIPTEKVPLKVMNGNNVISTDQEIILINAITIPGFSGSPVFLAPVIRSKNKNMTFGGKPLLLGIMSGFFPSEPRETIKYETTDAKFLFEENSGIAIVFPSWRIHEILDQDSYKRRMEIIFKQIP
jgi:hypothetical protein